MAGISLRGFYCSGLSRRAPPICLPQRKPRVFEPPPPEFNWTGLYHGIHAGGGVDHFAFPFGIFAPVRLKRFTASPRQGYLTTDRVPRRARVYFPMLEPSASALNMPSLKTSR
jgi:hypothetical protein